METIPKILTELETAQELAAAELAGLQALAKRQEASQRAYSVEDDLDERVKLRFVLEELPIVMTRQHSRIASANREVDRLKEQLAAAQKEAAAIAASIAHAQQRVKPGGVLDVEIERAKATFERQLADWNYAKESEAEGLENSRRRLAILEGTNEHTEAAA